MGEEKGDSIFFILNLRFPLGHLASEDVKK